MDLKNKLSIYTKESIKDVMIHSKQKFYNGLQRANLAVEISQSTFDIFFLQRYIWGCIIQ